jgi:hypothetical protein
MHAPQQKFSSRAFLGCFSEFFRNAQFSVRPRIPSVRGHIAVIASAVPSGFGKNPSHSSIFVHCNNRRPAQF